MAHHHAHTPEEHEPPDVWHTHTAAEKPQTPHAENISHGTVLVFGVGGFLIIAFTVVAMIVYFNWYKTGLMAERTEGVQTHVAALADRAKALEQDFRTIGWADAQTGAVRLTLEAARQRVIEQYAGAQR